MSLMYVCMYAYAWICIHVKYNLLHEEASARVYTVQFAHTHTLPIAKILKQVLYSTKRALYSVQRVPYSLHIALLSVKRAVFPSKEPYFPSQRPCNPKTRTLKSMQSATSWTSGTPESNVSSEIPHILSIEPYVTSEKPYMLSQKLHLSLSEP